MLTTTTQGPNSSFKAFKSMMNVYKTKIKEVQEELKECEIDVPFAMVVAFGETEYEYNTTVIPIECFAWLQNEWGEFDLNYVKACMIGENKTIEAKIGQQINLSECNVTEKFLLTNVNSEVNLRVGKYILEFETKFSDYLRPPIEV